MNFTALATYVLISAFTPGPNNLMSLANSIKYGYMKSRVFRLGVFTGCALVMMLCALATSFLYELIPTVEPVMRWVGAIYICYLAVMLYRDTGEEKGERKTILSPNSFVTGFLMQLVNIKVILYGITVFSTFILPHYRSAGAVALAIAALSLIVPIANSCWALFGSLFQNFYAAHRKTLNTVMALLLLYSAIGIVAN